MTQNEKRLVAGLTLASLALLAAALGVLLTVGRRPPPGPDPAIDDLRQQLRALQAEVAALRRQPPDVPFPGPPMPARDGGALAVVRPAEAAPVRYARFEGPDALHIEQVESGDLRVTNTDPALTGHLVTITAFDADGGRHALPVLVPPPGT